MISKGVIKEDIFKEYLKIVNCVFGLSPSELELTAELISSYREELLTSQHRIELQKKIGINNYSLNNRIFSLKNKGIILERESFYSLLPVLIPEIKNGKIVITFELKINE
jgi:predicted transcriptional regulator